MISEEMTSPLENAEEGEREEEPLNYKEAYLQIFNFLTDLINKLRRIQKIAEAICTGDLLTIKDLELDKPDELMVERLEKLQEYVKYLEEKAFEK